MTPAELITATQGLPTSRVADWLGVARTTLWRYYTGKLEIPRQTAMLCAMLHAGELPERFKP